MTVMLIVYRPKDHDSSAQTTEESTTDGTSVSSAPSATHTRKGTCPTRTIAPCVIVI